MANKRKEFKKQILANLPKGFRCNISKSGLHIYLYYDNGFSYKNELAIKKLCKKFKLDVVGSGTNLFTGVRDWDLIDINLGKLMKDEAKNAYNAIKSFFDKWKNDYYSNNTYSIVNKICDMIEKIRE